jgi:HK97 family phage portal protein
MRFLGVEISFRTTREIALETELRNLQQQGPSGWGSVYDSVFNGGSIVTREKALSVPAVYSAVDVVSKTLASLPFEPFKRTAIGSEPAVGHPLYVMETLEPSPLVTAFNFRRDMFADACFGNALAKISFNGRGRAWKLERMPPAERMPYLSEGGELYWIWTHRTKNGSAVTEILFEHEVLHLRGMTLDGYEGIDIPKTVSASIGMSIDATRYGGNYFYNNAAVDAVVEFPNALDVKSRQIIEDKIKAKHAGINNVGGVMVLDAGAKYNKFGTNPQEAMLNETRTFQAYESCRIFGVPAHMINVLDRSTFNNIEVMDNSFVKYCLSPWAQNFEQECDVKLLTQDEKTSGSIFHRFDLSGLMRGDMKSRGEYFGQMLTSMVYTINDVRRLDNLNPVPWGDTPYAQAGITKVNEDGTIQAPQGEETPAAENSNDNEDGEPQAGN